MMKITVISIGKLKEKYFKDAANEYIKRLSAYCDISVREIVPESLPEKPSAAQTDAALLKEAEKAEKQIPKNAFTVALCVEGRGCSSETFAKLIKENCDKGTPVCFIIGSSCGLHESLKQKADMRLSFSDMTFPHKLFKVMLLEQIYRAFKINGGGTYHK